MLLLFGLWGYQIPRTEAVPQATREVLPNGMVLLHVEQRELPLVTVTLTLPAGTLAETAAQAGLAPLTAALLQEGTTTHSGEELAQEITTLGGRISFDAGRDTASGQMTVVRADLEKGLQLLAEMLLHPTFPEDELARKIHETIGQIRRSRQDPATVAQVTLRQALYGKHPYGRRVLGSEETLQALTRADVVRFHQNYYKPQGSIGVVVGDVSQEEAKTLLLHAFAGWTGAPQPFPDHPKMTSPDDLDVIKLDRDVSQAHILFGHAGIRRDHPDYYAVEVMNYILGSGGFESRLLTRIREEQGLAYSAWSAFSTGLVGGTFMAGLSTKNATANQALQLFFETMRHLQQQPVSEQELADAKAHMIGSFPLNLTSNRELASIFTTIELFHLGLDYLARYPDLIRAVTPDDVQRVARQYVHPDRGVLVILADLKRADVQY
jgi:zinc protease